jgi:outer membrane protein OmpA-like peptidoglycan-associated protein
MKTTLRIITTIVLTFTTVVSAQEDTTTKKGDQEFKEYAYSKAKDTYLKASDKGKHSAALYQRLGDSYYFNADYVKAGKWYAKLYEMGSAMDSEYLYRYALCLKSSEQYVASDKVMEEFYSTNGNDLRANRFNSERDYLAEIEAQSGRFKLGKFDYNSGLSDFAPSYNQGEVVFATNRSKGRASKLIHNWNDQPFLDLYQVSDTGEGGKIKAFDKGINTKYHESTAVFTKDGTTMYFTRNNYTNDHYKQDSEGTNRLKLYRATRESGGDWSVEELPFNSDEYSVAHPALSVDGKTLYFASDMPGSKGMSDIFKVSIQGESFGKIENLGDQINTEGRETFPFVSSEGKLYYASDGHVGLGGLDIFVTELDSEGNPGDSFNLGRPINGPNDDFTLIINEKLATGYFASNRAGGQGDDDIYKFVKTQNLITKCEQTVEGVVLDKETDLPIGFATVKLLDENNKEIEEQQVGADGAYRFQVECGKQYSIRSEKDGMGIAEKVFTTPNKTGVTERSLFMKGKEDLPAPVGTDLAKLLGITIIYFDLDKDYIRPDAEVELRKVIAVMKEYPKLRIDVRSHTDSRNSDAYNMDLSSRRAGSTVDYLVNVGGISRSRLTGNGYGERQLVNRCSDGVTCSEAEHQLNRRSEFIIVE